MRLSEFLYCPKFRIKRVIPGILLGLITVSIFTNSAKANPSFDTLDKVQSIKQSDDLITSSDACNDFSFFFVGLEKENFSEEEKRNHEGLAPILKSSLGGRIEIENTLTVSLGTSSPPRRDLSLTHLSTIVFLN